MKISHDSLREVIAFGNAANNRLNRPSEKSCSTIGSTYGATYAGAPESSEQPFVQQPVQCSVPCRGLCQPESQVKKLSNADAADLTADLMRQALSRINM